MNWPDLLGTRVSLVYPPYGLATNEPGTGAVKSNYGLFPSLSLLYVAGVLEACRVTVQVIDANALRLSPRQVIARLTAFRPHLVGYTLTTYHLHDTLTWIRTIRESTGIPTLVGGVHMGLYPRETFTHRQLDYGVTGEAEICLPALLTAIRSGGSAADVPGVVYRDGNGRTVVTSTPPLLEDVDAAPEPARHLVDHRPYHSFISHRRPFTPLMTSRGCSFRCIFCEQGSQPFRPRSPGAVADEIERLVRDLGVRELDLFDSAFTTDGDRVHALCQELRRRDLGVVWAARSRVDTVDEPMLRAMAAAGCVRVYYGLESGVPEILRTLHKATDLDQMRRALRWTRAAGLDTFGYFMIGNPGDTLDTVERTVQLSLQLDLDYVQYSKVTPMPGTALYGMLVEQTGRDWWREIVLDADADRPLPRPGCDLSEVQIQDLVRRAYLRFYARPGTVMRAVRRFESLAEARRSARAFVQVAAGR